MNQRWCRVCGNLIVENYIGVAPITIHKELCGDCNNKYTSIALQAFGKIIIKFIALSKIKIIKNPEDTNFIEYIKKQLKTLYDIGKLINNAYEELKKFEAN